MPPYLTYRYHPTDALPDAPMSQWEHHSMFDTIYTDIKSWQGIANCQDPVTKSMIDYLQTLVKAGTKDPHSLTYAFIVFAIMSSKRGGEE